MARKALSIAALLVLATPSLAQVVSVWRAVNHVPVAVVETPGGDLEHLVLVTSADAAPPAVVLGYPAMVTTQPGAAVWSVSVPELLATMATGEALSVCAAGCAAVVLVGPVSARDLRAPLAAIDTYPSYTLARAPCVVADGATQRVRGTDERVELVLAAPPPSDPRFPLVPALATWLRLRLAPVFAGLRVDDELTAGCATLRLTAAAADDEPAAVLTRLRAALGELLREPATDVEAAAVRATLIRRTAGWATDSRALARRLAVLAAYGGDPAGAVVPAAVDTDVLASIAAGVLAHHRGAARLVEREQRAGRPAMQTLDNGVVISWRWVPGEVAVSAIALGGLMPAAGRATAQTIATAAAGSGWVVDAVDLFGVQVVIVAVPAGDVAATLELAAGVIGERRDTAVDPISAELAGLLGLATAPAAESLAIAMALPVTAEEAPEAAVKFFAGVPAGGLRSLSTPAGGALSWRQGDLPARLAAVVELPAGAAGLLAGEVLAERVRGAGVTTSWLAAPGRILLRVDAQSSDDVPALDAARAASWPKLRRPPEEGELRGAARRLGERLSGDLGQATARDAATLFLPALPTPAALLAVEPAAVAEVLASLPEWSALPRVAHGPAPADEDVRQSVAPQR